jgi:hypothetical protein
MKFGLESPRSLPGKLRGSLVDPWEELGKLGRIRREVVPAVESRVKVAAIG